MFFATDKDIILPRSFPLLGVVRDVLVAQPEIAKVEIQGHTDNTGSDAHNQDLSQRRAVSVATVLASRGVDQRRFFIEGRGEEDPIASNSSESGRSQNRRVEIQISPIAAG